MTEVAVFETEQTYEMAAWANFLRWVTGRQLLPRHLSYSAATTWEDCHRKWNGQYVLFVPDPSGPEADTGTRAHRLLEGLGRLSSERRTPEVAAALAKRAWRDVPVEQRRLAMGHVLRALRNLEVSYGDVIAVEMDLDLMIGGVPFKGFLDRADELPSGAVHIIDYKGLALDTPLPTPTGWTTMGAVGVGDQLVAPDGTPCTVTVKSGIHQRSCYRVKFDDGSTVVADNVHMWAVETDNGPQVLATEDLPANLRGRSGQRHLRIPNTAPLDLPDVDLPLDPWVLGYWLGNGKHTSSEITYGDLSVETVVASRGFELGSDTGSTCPTRIVLGIRGALRHLGVLGHKHVPDIYLRASAEQRLDLLRGLLDSDGGWNTVRNQAVFVNLNKGLARAVYELVVSLGWKASWWEGRGSGFGKVVHQHRVSFTPFGQVPFLTSKANGVRVAGTARARRRLVVAVDEIPSVSTACVAVDSPEHLFLAGEQMVPTHNTGKHPGKRSWLEEKFIQILLYAAGYETLTGRPVYEASFVWTAIGRVDTIQVSPARIRSAVKWLAQIWKEINEAVESNVFEPNPGHLCSWCPMVALCPEGQLAVIDRAQIKGKSIGAHGQAVLDEIGVWQMEATLAMNEKRRHLSVVPDEGAA